MRRRLCAAILTLEAVMAGLIAPVLISVTGTSAALGLGVGLGLCLACLLVAGLLRYDWAYFAGWTIQFVAIGLGFLITAMFLLGAIFLALWATASRLGARIERERAEAELEYLQQQPPNA